MKQWFSAPWGATQGGWASIQQKLIIFFAFEKKKLWRIKLGVIDLWLSSAPSYWLLLMDKRLQLTACWHWLQAAVAAETIRQQVLDSFWSWHDLFHQGGRRAVSHTGCGWEKQRGTELHITSVLNEEKCLCGVLHWECPRRLSQVVECYWLVCIQGRDIAKGQFYWNSLCDEEKNKLYCNSYDRSFLKTWIRYFTFEEFNSNEYVLRSQQMSPMLLKVLLVSRVQTYRWTLSWSISCLTWSDLDFCAVTAVNSDKMYFCWIFSFHFRVVVVEMPKGVITMWKDEVVESNVQKDTRQAIFIKRDIRAHFYMSERM